MLNYLIVLITLLLTVTANSQNNFNGFDVNNSIIPKNEILSGGPPKDGIPAILQPKFITADKANWLKDNDFVAGISIKGEKRAYPVRILVWHELVNDNVGNVPILITYCPLCGSIIAFSRSPDKKELTFGVSGLLYQSDVLFYDHQTGSLWSQLEMKAISGKYVNTDLEVIPYIFSTWKEWKENNPETLVLSKDTGHIRDYDRDPYTSYYSSKNIMFPVNNKSERFHPKERVLVVISGDSSKAYPFKALSKRKIINDSIGDEKITIKSNGNNYFDVRNNNGELKKYLIAYWFAWYTFKPDTLVFE
ncbi:MAG: DUF3179 domain-containing protein [Thermodesulfobacteriota bacterium]